MGAARARHRIAIGKSDQGTAQVSSIHDARAREACPEAAWLPPGQRWAGPTGLVTLRCAGARVSIATALSVNYDTILSADYTDYSD